jgi:hypothetical protein
MITDGLVRGLNAFAQQFDAQVANAGPPGSEHAVHFCLALGIQAAYELPPGSIVFERPAGARRIDLWVAPADLLIEVKYQRPIPSGRNLPVTQLFGGLLADFNKVRAVKATARLVVFVTDALGVTYLRNSARGLLPLDRQRVTSITGADIQRLAATAARNALADGPWGSLSAELVWDRVSGDWSLFAWRVAPVI